MRIHLLVLAALASVSVQAFEAGKCASYNGLPAGRGETTGMVFVPGGSFTMGSEDNEPEERFKHPVRVDGFWIDRHEVTNAQFKAFVEATGYITLAERGLDAKSHPDIPEELRVPGSVVFIAPTQRGGRVTNWWQYVAGASWRRPQGPDSTIVGKENHPVVHIAHDDALAYAKWRGRSLPTEAQWEFASRGGGEGVNDRSGAYDARGKAVANTWQGIFPVKNDVEDGYEGTAPVGCFAPNGYGLADMFGNVWEWTDDWYKPGHSRDAAVNPKGPVRSSVRAAPGVAPSRVIKGGSHLCAPNFCARYRSAARQPQESNLGAAHLGFRTVLNKPDSAKQGK